MTRVPYTGDEKTSLTASPGEAIPPGPANGARTGTQPWTRLYADGHGEHWDGAADYIERNLPAWRRALR